MLISKRNIIGILLKVLTPFTIYFIIYKITECVKVNIYRNIYQIFSKTNNLIKYLYYIIKYLYNSCVQYSDCKPKKYVILITFFPRLLFYKIKRFVPRFSVKFRFVIIFEMIIKCFII